MVWPTTGVTETKVTSGVEVPMSGMGPSMDWINAGVKCTGLGGTPSADSPLCTNIAPPSWATVVGRDVFNKGYVFLPPKFDIAPYAGIEFWKTNGLVTHMKFYRYASVQDAFIGNMPTSPETFYANSDGSAYAGNASPSGSSTKQMCGIGQAMAGIYYHGPQHLISLSDVELRCVDLYDQSKGEFAYPGSTFPQAVPGDPFPEVGSCFGKNGSGSFMTNVITQVPSGQANTNRFVLNLECSSSELLAAYKNEADNAQVLPLYPICTGKQGATIAEVHSAVGQGGTIETQSNFCAAHAKKLCSGPNPPMPYCACINADPLAPGVSPECLSANGCSGLNYSTMWVDPTQMVDPCKGATITICSVLPQMSASNINLVNDKITVECGSQYSKTCPTCKTGLGDCVSETDPTVCRPAGSDGTCGSGWKKCGPAPPPSGPTGPSPPGPGATPTPPAVQPWWGIFTNSAPLVIDGKNIGTIGHWMIGGVAAAGLIVLLLLVYFMYQYM